jgi:hypothetical protein
MPSNLQHSNPIYQTISTKLDSEKELTGTTLQYLLEGWADRSLGVVVKVHPEYQYDDSEPGILHS